MKLLLAVILFYSGTFIISVSNFINFFNHYFTNAIANDSVAINSIQISRVSVTPAQFKNEFGYSSGWIELENTADRTICLQDGKWSISNDSENALLYIFQKDILIAPHSHLLIWCDKLNVIQTNIHSNFKLNPQVGEIWLYHFDEDHNHKCVDSLRYNNTTAANS